MQLQHLDEVVGTVRSLMDGFPAHWCVAGGWALDLFLGQKRRAHADLELALFRQDQGLLHGHLRRWTFEKVINGVHQPWREGEVLSPPVHEIHARSVGDPSRSIEFLLNERNGDQWSFRRNPAVALPVDRAIVRESGVPVLAPEIVVLFKAKSPRPKDEADVRTACAAMNRSRQQWLRAALQVCHAGHPWIAWLDAATGSGA